MTKRLIEKIRDWIWYRQSMKAYRRATNRDCVEKQAAIARIPMEIFGSDEEGWFMCPKISREAEKELGRRMRTYYRFDPVIRSLIDFHIETSLNREIQD